MLRRVLFPFRGSEIGGTHVATFTLARALSQRYGLSCEVICPGDTLIMREARNAGLRTIVSEETPTARNSVISDYQRLGARGELLKREGVGEDCVLHCNDINSLRAWGLSARLAGATVIYHHHALNRLWWPPHLISLAWANGVIAVSDSTLDAIVGIRRDAVKELNPFDLDPGYDRAAARRALVSEFGWPADARIVGWIGNFWARKRPEVFLETAAAITKRDSRCRFVLFGRDGDHTIADIREQAIDLGLDHVTAVPGFRQPAAANLASLDLLLAPAPQEPFGRALVEAIVLGVPIVASAGAGHSEIINTWGGGRLVDAKANPIRLGEVCLSLLNSTDSQGLPRARRDEISAQLAPKAHAGRVLAVYDLMRREGRIGPPSAAVSL